MAGRESPPGLLASSETSRASSSSSAASPPTPLSRAVGNSQMCILLILVVGFLLIFSYQSEVHTVVLGQERRQGHSTLVAEAIGTSEPLVRKPILSVRHQSGSKSIATSRSAAVRMLEAEPTNSTIEVTSPPPPAPPPPPKKIDWKDVKTEAYKPEVDSVHSNVLSSNFQLVIKLLALNDYDSLQRCLYSLSEAKYAGDSVDIHIYIDHFEISDGERRRRLLADRKTETTAKVTDENSKAERIKRMKERNRLQTSSIGKTVRKLGGGSSEVSKSPRLPDRVATGVESVKPSDWGLVEERLSDARKVLNHAESFQWKHGKKVIHYRTRTAGSQSQWLDAWWPSSDDEFALFLEDDAEVSPLFYRYARSLIATYYYQPSHYDRSLYGISLQRQQIVPGKGGLPLKVDDRTRLFKYQMVGIWGQIFFPKPWKEFREWYDSKKSHDIKPLVDGMVTTDWYKQHGEKMFTPWFVKFSYSRGYFNLYTNFLRDRVLSVTHREIGGKPKKYAGCDSVLIWANGTYDLDLWHMAANWHIKRYDYCFKEVRSGRFANYSSEVGWVLESAAQDKKLLVVSTVGVPEVLVRNWLCMIRKLGVENYVLIGEDPVLLEDLARRGHATMRIENKSKLKESIEKEVSAVSELLELGYTLWFTRADTVWVGNPISLVDTNGVDVIGLENSVLNLFFIRSTEKTIVLWGNLNKKLSKANTSRGANWETAREDFISKSQEEGVSMGKLDQVVFIDAKQLTQPPTVESAGASADAQVLVLSAFRSLEESETKEKVRQLELWNLDDDLVCATLTC